jgi:BirA family biotin operon repressor/biotin-[acetyl-CoA-carboxylase] ligase
MSANAFDLERLRQGTDPVRVLWFPCLRSTNQQAAAMVRCGELAPPALVLAGRQVAGRGRGANTWWSNCGCITATLVAKARGSSAEHASPMMVGGVLRKVVVQVTGETHIHLKWPNDLLLGTRKLAGVLCERIGRVELVGVGLNVNVRPGQCPTALRQRITSLSEVTARQLDKTDVLIRIVLAVHGALLDSGPATDDTTARTGPFQVTSAGRSPWDGRS